MSPKPVQPDEIRKPRKPLWWRILKRTLCVIAALLVVAAVAWAIFSYISAKALREEIEKIRAAGQPVTFAQLSQLQPKVEEADDAAPFYKAAMHLRRASTDKNVGDLLEKLRELTDEGTGKAPTELAAEIEAVLADNALALEMIDRGASRPQCAYDFGHWHGIAVALPQFGGSRALARVLCLRTRWLARQGRADAAADSLLSSLRMLRIFDRQPVLITYLVKMACTALCVRSVPAVLEGGPLSDQQLAELALALRRAETSQNVQQMFIGERVYMLELWRNLISPKRRLELGDAPRLPEAAPPPGFPGSFLGEPIFRMMMVRQLQMYGQYVAAAGKDWPEALEAMRAAAKQPRGVFGLFVDILAPSINRAMVICGRGIGSVRSAELAVAAERYRLANGRLPASLDELRQLTVGELPADPFTGLDLIYKTVGADGFMVYSVGEDRTDDGGPLLKPQKDWGVAVRVPRASASATQPR